MPPQDEPPDSGDWSFPPVEPASPSSPSAEPTSPLGFEPPTTDHLPLSSSSAPLAQAAPAPPALTEPVPMPNLHVPRRVPAEGGPVSPMRAMAGALVAVAGVLLGIGALLWATDAPSGDPQLTATQAQRTASSPSPLPSPSSTQASPSPSPSPVVVPAVSSAPSARPTVAVTAPKLPLTVLNNSNRTGLADRAARRFRAGGWPIKLTGNFTGRVSDTTVYYAPGQLESARLLQRSFAGLTRVRPRFEGLPGSGLTVVLTRDFNA